MIGKDLIIYILNNGLENSDVVDILKKALLTEKQIAAKFCVGVDTIRAWQSLHFIDGFMIGNSVYYYVDTKDPRKKVVC